MSKYTTEVRFICEHYAGLDESTGFNNVHEVIETARPKVFDFDFPIFDEEYRSVIETKILKHYYTREIGAETVGLWKFWLETRLNEIMPYYNKLYETTLISFNPLLDTDITTTKDGALEGAKTDTQKNNETTNNNVDTTFHSEGSENNSNTSESETNVSGSDSSHTGTTSTNMTNGTDVDNDWDMYSDTPQGGINGLDANTYLTNARHNTKNNTNSSNSSGTNESTTNNSLDRTTNDESSNRYNGSNEVDSTNNQSSSGSKISNSNGTSNFNNTENWIEHITGKRGAMSYSKMLQEFRDTILNIDVAIISDLSDLFMGLW